MQATKVAGFLRGLSFGTPHWFTAFILMIVLMPLPFGSNRPWSSDLFAVLSGIILAGTLWAQRDIPFLAQQAPRLRIALSAAAFTLVILWSTIQVLTLTPESWHHPLWQEASLAIGEVSGSISVDRGVFPEALSHLIAYAACFLIAFLWGRNHDNAKAFVKALAFAGVAYALYGLLVQSMGSSTILWYEKWAYKGFLTSTFVNKNSYAAYAGLGILCTLAYLGQRYKKFVAEDQVIAKQSKLAAFIVSLRLRDYGRLMMPIVLLAALTLTGSRAGIASSLVGMGALLFGMALHKRWQTKRSLIVLGALGFLLVIFITIGGETLLARMDQNKFDEDAGLRLAGYNLALTAITDNPWLGFGLGTFNNAFRLYRDSTLPLWFHHAHNDYLEMMMDLGIPAALLLFSAIGLLISCCVTGLWQRRRRGIYPALALGASALMLAHALFDFSWHIPAITATYAALLGIGVAQSWSSREEKS